MNEQELRETVELCWRVACDVKLPGADATMVVADKVLSSIRYGIFQSLLAHRVPQVIDNSIRHNHEKEAWEE